MTTKEEILAVFKERLPYFKEKYGVKSLGLFGSYARGNATDKSDVDIVVELESPLGFEFFTLANDLEILLGEKINLLTPLGVRSIRHQEIKDNILRDLTYVTA